MATNFCHLLITIANSLDLDQDRQNIGSDQDPNCLALMRVFLKEFFEKVNFVKKVRRPQNHEIVTQRAKS